LEFFEVSVTFPHIEFHEKPSSWNDPDFVGRVTERQTRMMKLMGAFREYANTPETCIVKCTVVIVNTGNIGA
jgi:hypothetical protein